MRLFIFRRSSSGQGLIQALIGIAVLSIMMAAFGTLIANQNREITALQQKVSAIDFKTFMTSVLADGSVCQYVLNNPNVLTFDSTKPLPQTLDLTRSNGDKPFSLFLNITPNPPGPGPPGPAVMTIGEPVSADSPTVVVKSAALRIESGSGSSYRASWVFDYDSSKLIRTLRPANISTLLKVDATDPTAVRFVGCQSAGPAASGYCAPPGTKQQCTDSGGASGSQVCQSDGTWGLCQPGGGQCQGSGGAYVMCGNNGSCVTPNSQTNYCNCPAGSAPRLAKTLPNSCGYGEDLNTFQCDCLP